jgi:acetyl-CoA acetyltransferase
MFRREVSAAEVRASPLICDPLRLFMLCSPNEGAAALVLSASPPADGPPVRVVATALRSHLPGDVLGEHTPAAGLAGARPPSATALAARDVFEATGIAPGDVDVVEVQDTDAARELIAYEELGLCAPGEAAGWLAAGHSAMGGRQPVNPSGGLLSKGEPLGASALAQLVELYWQLRGEAGVRQVPGARPRLAHSVGRGANAAVTILSR